MSLQFDHLGVVVRDVNVAAKVFGDVLGIMPWEKGIVEDVENGVRMLSLPTGNTFIELIQPVKPDNRFGRFLQERGPGLFHLCFFSYEFDRQVAVWQEKGYDVEIETAHSFPGHPFRLAWLRPETTNGVWIEMSDAAAIPEQIRNHQF